MLVRICQLIRVNFMTCEFKVIRSVHTCQPSRFYRDNPDFCLSEPPKFGTSRFSRIAAGIPVFKIIFKDINHIFLVFFLQIEGIQISFIDLNRLYDWLVDFGAECSARSICFNLPLPPSLVCGGRGGGVRTIMKVS